MSLASDRVRGRVPIPILIGGGTSITSKIVVSPTAVSILDTTPLGTTVATIVVVNSDGSAYAGSAPVLTDDDGHRFILSGPTSGPGPYSLILNPAGPGLPASMSLENVQVTLP